MNFYGDGSNLDEVYGRNREDFNLASSKFHDTEQLADYGGRD